MTDTLIGADEICVAAETVLRQALPLLTELLEVDDRYGPIQEWQQLPTNEALTSAKFPAIAISSPGLTDRPTKDGRGEWTATWRLGVGIYDRGKDHADTQAKVRDWCKYIRTVLLLNRTLGGVATGLSWVGEEYRLVTRKDQARTFGGGFVLLDVTAENVLDLGPDLWPLVSSTHPSLIVQPPLQSQE